MRNHWEGHGDRHLTLAHMGEAVPPREAKNPRRVDPTATASGRPPSFLLPLSRPAALKNHSNVGWRTRFFPWQPDCMADGTNQKILSMRNKIGIIVVPLQHANKYNEFIRPFSSGILCSARRYP